MIYYFILLTALLYFFILFIKYKKSSILVQNNSHLSNPPTSIRNSIKNKLKFADDLESKNEDFIKELSYTNNKLPEKDSFVVENLLEKEKIQETLESFMKNNDIDSEGFKEVMLRYGKKFAGLEEKQIDDLLNTRKNEQYSNIMKSIGDIKHKIDYLDLKETYLDSFLSIGKFDQGATLMKIK